MWLLTANDTYTIEELADMLDTSPRTIYRYLDTFKAAGFSVRKHKEHYSLTKESKYFEEISQLVHFTDEEALIFNKLLDGLDNSNMLKQNLRESWQASITSPEWQTLWQRGRTQAIYIS